MLKALFYHFCLNSAYYSLSLSIKTSQQVLSKHGTRVKGVGRAARTNNFVKLIMEPFAKGLSEGCEA